MKGKIIRLLFAVVMLMTATACPMLEIGEPDMAEGFDAYVVNETPEDIYVFTAVNDSYSDVIKVKPYRKMELFRGDLVWFKVHGFTELLYVITDDNYQAYTSEEIVREGKADKIININYVSLMENKGVYRITESDLVREVDHVNILP